jgi:ATP-dependent RNA helicase HelY
MSAIEALGDRLRDDEEEVHLPRTRQPDPGFAEVAWRWARGDGLERVLGRAEMAPGDFVRNAKQLIDLLHQLQLVAPVPATRRAAAQAADALQRGVVAASAGPPLPGSKERPALDDGVGEGLGTDEIPARE